MAKYTLLVPLVNPTAFGDATLEPYVWAPIFRTSNVDLLMVEAATRYLTKGMPCRFEVEDLTPKEEEIFKAAEAKMSAEVEEYWKQQRQPAKPNLEIVT